MFISAKVLCPEHAKDAKVSDTEVCGCPLAKDVFIEDGALCRVLKKNCVRHFCWEKLRRAEIDMERVRQWLKIDELIEQERQIRHAMSSRAGVLALMLHSTYNHELYERLSAQQKKEEISDVKD
jgi:COMPASS component SPP1